MTVAVRYEYAPGSEVQRDEHRPAHVAFLSALHERGVLLISGRLEDPDRPGALLVLAVTDAAVAARLLDDDPFRAAGVIAHRDLRPWTVAFGGARLES